MEQHGQYKNVYLDAIEPVDEPGADEADTDVPRGSLNRCLTQAVTISRRGIAILARMRARSGFGSARQDGRTTAVARDLTPALGPPVALVAAVVAVALAVLGTVLLALAGASWQTPEPIVAVTFGPVGALIARRDPTNPVGWLAAATALVAASEYAGGAYAAFAIAHGGIEWAADLARWVSRWAWCVSAGVGFAILPLVFPDGRLLSKRWRPAVWFSLASITVAAGVRMVFPLASSHALLPSKWPGAGQHSLLVHVVDVVYLLPLLAAAALALSSMVLRFRQSRGETRLQLKWVVASAVLAGGLLVPEFLLGGTPGLVIGGVTHSLVALSVGVAMLRYHLYEIDFIINRTLVYGALTALLACAYVGSVLVLGVLLHGVTGRSGLAVAVSTLLVAGLFRPARSRIQQEVDRRFYRRKYDAQNALEQFSERLRHEVDLEVLVADLQDVIIETMQPAHISVWLRQPRGT